MYSISFSFIFLGMFYESDKFKNDKKRVNEHGTITDNDLGS